ncbi:PREDICTED: uncharacterized protein LOC108969606 [Bactrocera latifrons]|uniref:uncharacterized protein LOC108969606 n=1 Tax=Bactrocera latifrons TaxID=174628 RepID=UPI0008DCDC38|nr:PREDICTED: uncharacterized protein LOC108969606 [Bactrocera latifrons]
MFTKAAIPSALSLRLLFAVALLIFVASPATPAKIPTAKNGGATLRGQAVIDAVPLAERAAFIRYNLAKAVSRFNSAANNATDRSAESRLFLQPSALLSPTQLLEFENIPTYPEFGEDVFYWLRDTLEVTEDNIYSLLNTRSGGFLICTEDGICYDAPYLGICCPF